MLKCEQCNKEFENYRALNGHKRMHDKYDGKQPSRRKIYNNHCDYCGEHINKKRMKNENKFCRLSCFHNHKWENIDKIRVLNGNGSSRTIRRYLIEKHREMCSVCGINNEWDGKPLVIQVDHIDGNSDNNKVNNLRLLCPNCHTQTPTYGSKGVGSRYRKDTKRNKKLRKHKGY